MHRTRLAAQSVGAGRARILRRYVILKIIGFAAVSFTVGISDALRDVVDPRRPG
jgi:ABC-type dipeptide/oligopeptide/nickel transport system permease subunit